MKPIFTEVIFVLHLIISTVIFAFLLANKYCLAHNTAVPFKWLLLDMQNGVRTPLYTVSEILIFAAFGLSFIYLVNYNIVLTGSIFRKVKRIYGGERD